MLRKLFSCLCVGLLICMMTMTVNAASNGYCKGIRLCGKVRVVEHSADLKVKVVNSFPDLKVKRVNHFPREIGEWQFVTHGEDFTIQYVTSFPDLKIKFVDHFPGVN